YDNGSRSGGRGRGISGNIGIGGGSNVSEFRYQDADYDNGSRSEGRGRGKSGNIGSRGSSTSGCSNSDADYDNGSINYDNGSRSGGRGRGKSRNIGGHGSSTSGCSNPDADYDNGSINRGRGRSGNIDGRGSSSTSRCGNPDAYFDTNDNETETSQRDLYQWHPSENAVMYKAWERVMSSRYSDILGQCRRDAAHRATIDNITVGNDLSVLKPYTPSWIDQAHWDNMIDRLKKEKKWPVSLLEAYHRTHTSTNVSSEASGSGMDESSEGRTREYVTTSSKRVADAVEVAIVEKHRPDASKHPPNDFDL
ncbi:hypothetical protein Tco_0637942, partial [Tanacetum coccineum]